MKVENIKRVAVIGAGNMGAQIAQQLSQVGQYQVEIVDIDDGIVGRGLGGIRTRLRKFFVDKNKMTQNEMEEVMGRISGTTDMAKAVKGVDFVIESITEKMDIKRTVFKQLDESARPETIFSSNTSALNITDMGIVTGRPDKVVGMHFFNPVAVMKLVEVVRGTSTSNDTVDVTCALSRKLGKEPVVCTDYSYGFLANRVYDAMSREAAQMVWEHVASPEDIDKAVKLGYNLPMGPLELEDMAGGWGLKAHGEEARIKEIGEKGRLPAIIKIMVRAGYSGGPGKKGIYDFWKEVMNR